MQWINESGRVGIALLGFGHFHQYHWVKAFGSDARVEIIGFYEKDEALASSVESQHGLRRFGTVDGLLQHPQVTAAAICSETEDHLELTLACCRYKKAVLCEKPTAPSVAEARKMQEAVRKSEIPFVQVFPQRLIPGNIRIKEILDSGELGRITHVRKRHGHGFALGTLSRDMPWIVTQNRAGGGAYMDEGVHEADLLCYYFGMPESVIAQMSQLRYGNVEIAGTALYRFPNDITAVHEAGWNWVAGGPTTEIYGEKGVILESQTDCASTTGEPRLPHLSLFRISSGSWEILDEDFDFQTVHHLFPAAYIDVLLGTRECPATIDDGVRALEMVAGAYRSAETGARVTFPLNEA